MLIAGVNVQRNRGDHDGSDGFTCSDHQPSHSACWRRAQPEQHISSEKNLQKPITDLGVICHAQLGEGDQSDLSAAN
jgi:hypothetical protein